MTIPQIHTYTGQQLSKAFEQLYKTLSAQINKIKLHNNRLSSQSLIRNTALNALTFGEYKKLHDQQKEYAKDITMRDKCRDQIRAIEQKYTTPPHTVELSRELKALESNFAIIIEVNNKTLKDLQRQTAEVILEKRRLSGREHETFKTLTDKLAELPHDPLYQSKFINTNITRKF